MAPMKPKPKRPDPDLADTISLAELARRWKKPRKEIRQMLGRQQLGFIQVRGKFRIPLAEIEQYEKNPGR